MVKLYETGNTDSARQVLENAKEYLNISERGYVWTLIQLDVFDGNYQQALEQIDLMPYKALEFLEYYEPADALRGYIFTLMGDKGQARKHLIKQKKFWRKKRLNHNKTSAFMLNWEKYTPIWERKTKHCRQDKKQLT